VIYNQAQALLEGGDEVLIITGDEVPADAPFPGVCVKALQYDRPGPPEAPAQDSGEKARSLADSLLRAMENHWGGPADIIHVHNPLIQKNAALVSALNILIGRGLHFLLQNHDLAEDFRPDVYSHDEYPENCHYAVINSRDYSFLHRTGLKTSGLHLLPNEVFSLDAAPALERKRYLYPVRAIKRKNLGEALFLSLFIPKGRTIAITLPPTSEKDDKVYRFWVALAEELRLPVEFEIGSTDTFSRIIGSAYCVITTSVKEGFGFSFLEPWIAGRAVIGRRIDYVCKDFEDAGVRFDSLYSSINIPMVYISQAMLRKKMDHTIAGVYEAFGLEPPHYIIKMLNDELFSRDELDFGRMDEESQEYIIRTMVSNEAVFRDIAEANPFLMGLAAWRPDEDLIIRNRKVISDIYGRERIGQKIRDIYQAVYTTPVVHKISKTMLLELYLDPLRLSLVEVGNE
jgi:glycosyltransferase involved in cell wall biosynthesis